MSQHTEETKLINQPGIQLYINQIESRLTAQEQQLSVFQSFKAEQLESNRRLNNQAGELKATIEKMNNDILSFADEVKYYCMKNNPDGGMMLIHMISVLFSKFNIQNQQLLQDSLQKSQEKIETIVTTLREEIRAIQQQNSTLHNSKIATNLAVEKSHFPELNSVKLQESKICSKPPPIKQLDSLSLDRNNYEGKKEEWEDEGACINKNVNQQQLEEFYHFNNISEMLYSDKDKIERSMDNIRKNPVNGVHKGIIHFLQDGQDVKFPFSLKVKCKDTQLLLTDLERDINAQLLGEQVNGEIYENDVLEISKYSMDMFNGSMNILISNFRIVKITKAY